MRSITLAQAALFAALATLLLAGYYVVDNFALIGESPALVLLGSAVPSLVWAGFFFAAYRGPARSVAWITLVFGVLLEAVVVCVRFHQSVNYWTPFGNALSWSGWLLRIGWMVFLVSFALAPEHVRTRQAALVLAILAAPSALVAALDAWSSWTGFLFGEIPREAFARALITPAIRIIYWLSQILFLWTAWGETKRRDPFQASWPRLTL